MYRKTFSKASQEWLWTDADQNDSFSDSSYLPPIQRILQNEVMIARTMANTILDLEWFNEGYLLLVGTNSVTFLVGYCFDWMMQSLIDWLNEFIQSTSALDHRPALNRPCLHAWTQLTYFSCYQFSLPSLLSHEQSFLFHSVFKTPRGCQ